MEIQHVLAIYIIRKKNKKYKTSMQSQNYLKNSINSHLLDIYLCTYFRAHLFLTFLKKKKQHKI